MRVNTLCRKSRPARWGDGQYVGVEVEVENCRRDSTTTAIQGAGWMSVPDGSLRNNGREFISPPTAVDAMVKLLPNMYEEIFGILGCTSTVRTGIHVHFDMLNTSFARLGAVCAAYSLAEPALYAMLPAHRDQGIYCIPWYRAPSQAVLLRELLGQSNPRGESSRRILRNHCKYSGLNLGALATHGTLEFRMAPTFDSAEGLVDWIRALDEVVQAGLRLGTAKRVLSAISKDGINSILDRPNTYELAESMDGYYCAELLAGDDTVTWYKPELDIESTAATPRHRREPTRRSRDLRPLGANSATDLLRRRVLEGTWAEDNVRYVQHPDTINFTNN